MPDGHATAGMIVAGGWLPGPSSDAFHTFFTPFCRAIIYLVFRKTINRKNRVCMHFQQVHCTCSQHHRDVCLGSTRSGPMFSKARQFLKSRMRRRDPPPPPPPPGTPPPGTPPPGSDPPERRSRVRTTPNSFTCRFCQRVYRGQKKPQQAREIELQGGSFS